MSTRLLANIIIPIRITALTGLHIGTSNDDYEIGGMDNPVIKYFNGKDYDEKGSYPYIPGSSLKGKMRSLMEWAEGKIMEENSAKNIKAGQTHSCDELDCSICRIFGSSSAEKSDVNKKRGPARLIVRDCFPTQKTINFMDYLEESEGLPKVEVKHENSINRLTAKATPRPQERVPVGSKFVGELVYSIYEIDEAKNENQDAGNGALDIKHISKVIQALQLVEDSYLGGGGTRGSGKIKIEVAKNIIVRNASDYEKQTGLEKQPITDDEKKWDNDDDWQPLAEFKNTFKIDETSKKVILEASDDNKDDNSISNT